ERRTANRRAALERADVAHCGVDAALACWRPYPGRHQLLQDVPDVVPQGSGIREHRWVRDRHGGGGEGLRSRGSHRRGAQHLDGPRGGSVALPAVEMAAEIPALVLLRIPRPASEIRAMSERLATLYAN